MITEQKLKRVIKKILNEQKVRVPLPSGAGQEGFVMHGGYDDWGKPVKGSVECQGNKRDLDLFCTGNFNKRMRLYRRKRDALKRAQEANNPAKEEAIKDSAKKDVEDHVAEAVSGAIAKGDLTAEDIENFKAEAAEVAANAGDKLVKAVKAITGALAGGPVGTDIEDVKAAIGGSGEGPPMEGECGEGEQWSDKFGACVPAAGPAATTKKMSYKDAVAACRTGNAAACARKTELVRRYRRRKAGAAAAAPVAAAPAAPATPAVSVSDATADATALYQALKGAGSGNAAEIMVRNSKNLFALSNAFQNILQQVGETDEGGLAEWLDDEWDSDVSGWAPMVKQASGAGGQMQKMPPLQEIKRKLYSSYDDQHKLFENWNKFTRRSKE